MQKGGSLSEEKKRGVYTWQATKKGHPFYRSLDKRQKKSRACFTLLLDNQHKECLVDK